MSDEQSLAEVSSDDSDEATESTALKPATVTYRWQPDGAVCAQCGESTTKQWLDDGEHVCPDCKSWA